MMNYLAAPDAVLASSARIAPYCVIGAKSVVGADCELAAGVVLEDNVIIGENVTIGTHTTICRGTRIGAGSVIGAGCVLGRSPLPAKSSTVREQALPEPLEIGAGAIIGATTVVYAGTRLAEEVFLGDGALVREACRVGKNSLLGSHSIVENSVRIGERVKIQSGAYITAYMEIEDDVFIAPMVVTTNDNYMGRKKPNGERFQPVKGAVVRRGARIGGGSILLPHVEVASESFVAAGALVTRNTEPAAVTLGVPAHTLRKVPVEELLPRTLPAEEE
jgi:UDP-3-O-[3-hydroxymyristoyl] glucosamine N-acyltransferase